MILYNVTVNIDVEKEEEYVAWMKEEHIPDVMSTGLFEENKLFKLLLNVEDGGVNYSTQFFTPKLENVHHYQENFAAGIHEKLKHEFGDQLVFFGSMLEQVDL